MLTITEQQEITARGHQDRIVEHATTKAKEFLHLEKKIFSIALLKDILNLKGQMD